MTAHLHHPFHLNSAVATTSPNSSSPTTPTYPDHHRRPPTPQHSQTHTLDEVRIWTEDQVIEWLRDVGFGSHERAFADNSINGELLLEIDHQALKQLEIPTVGERVKILSAVKQLRRDCLGSPAPKYSKDRPILVLPTWDSRPTTISPSSSSSLPPHNSFLSALASSHGHTLPSYQQSQLQPESTRSDPNDKYSAALKSSSQLPPGSVQRSSSFTRILGRNETKKGTIRIGNGKGDEKDREKSGEQGISYTPTSPNTTVHPRRNSVEGPSISAGIMAYDKIKQQYVRVYGEDGQHRIVEVLSTPDVRTIMSKVLHKFGIENEDVGKYSIFVGSSDTGAARALTDEELLEICHSADRPEKERLILRKKHLFVTHEEFKRKGTTNHRLRKLQNFFGDGPVPSSLGAGNAVAATSAQNGMGMPGLGFVGFNGSSSSLQPPAIVSPSAHLQSYQPQQLYFQFNGSQPDKQQTLQIITSTYPASPSASTHAGSASPNYFSRHSPFPSSSVSGSWANTFSPHRQGPSTSVAARTTPSSKGPRLRQFFGERPPSEIISSNLQSFFPNHKPDVLETAGINAQRMSMRRGSSVSSRSLLVMPGSNVSARNPNRRSIYRDSVLPELVQTLGLELDKVSEDGDEDVLHHSKETDTEIAERDLDSDDRMDTDSEQSDMIETQRIITAEDEVEVRLEVRVDAEANGKAISQKTNGTVLAVDVVEEVGATLVAITASDNDKVVVDEVVDKEMGEEEEEEERKDIDSVVDDSLEEEEEEEEIADDAPIIRWMKGSLIGRGTFGDVYLGLNPLTGELMAVKQVELPVVNSATEDRKQSMVDALQREIALLKVLQHENIVQYLGSQSDEAHLNIFLEYVPGGSVAGLLASYGAFQEPLVRSFVKQILRGLCYLHQRDIIHRDIKGANILVDNKGGVKISDFGISKKVEDDMLSATNTGPHRPSLQGSVFWMAPEVVKQTQYTFKADIWSLGCLVVEMFTGDHPFPEYSQMQAMFKIGTSSSPAIPENISEEAKDFLRKTFEPEFQERPSAEVLLLHPFIDADGTFVPPGNMSTNTLVGF